MKYCALCCTAKDEDNDLAEWIAYHSFLGFDHFIIYDDLSTNPIENLLSPYVSNENITIIRNEKHKTQQEVYDHCINTYKNEFLWIAFLDCDEFIRITDHDSPQTRDIRCFLSEFEEYSGIGINWRIFSSSNHDKRPDGLVIKNYTNYISDDIHIKSIIKPKNILYTVNPHAFMGKHGNIVNPMHFTIPNGYPFSIPETDRIAINHYYYKSRQCFEEKIKRGNPCQIERKIQDFESHLSKKSYTDRQILNKVEAVENMLNNKQLTKNTDNYQSNINSDNILNLLETELFNKTAITNEKLQEFFIQTCKIVPLNDNDDNMKKILALCRAKLCLISKDTNLTWKYLNLAMKYPKDSRAFRLLSELYSIQGEYQKARMSLNLLNVN